jgi:pyruvate dehydrogenase E1 component alpha subunit
MLHAVGLGWAARLQGEDTIAITYFGDGATSEGDFHEAMNFAGVFRTPTVFVCENNQYAISMPRARQTAAETIAVKAAGYGMPGEYVDGNDVLAVYAVTTRAAERARDGDGPTLVEALTYRRGPHTTTDDAGRYRPQEEVDRWRALDPIDRVRRYLQRAEAWDESWERGVAEDAAAEIETAMTEAEALEPLSAEEVFAAMYREPTGVLEDQSRRLRRDRGGA